MPGKNKYLTFAFIVLFALSGTGLPVIVHLCNAMNETSLKSCGMCSHKTVPDKPAFSRTFDCCEQKAVSGSITDQYITVKSQKDIQIYSIAVLPFIAQVEEPAINYSLTYSGISPPQEKDTPLFIINSSFLI